MYNVTHNATRQLGQAAVTGAFLARETRACFHANQLGGVSLSEISTTLASLFQSPSQGSQCAMRTETEPKENLPRVLLRFGACINIPRAKELLM